LQLEVLKPEELFVYAAFTFASMESWVAATDGVGDTLGRLEGGGMAISLLVRSCRIVSTSAVMFFGAKAISPRRSKCLFPSMVTPRCFCKLRFCFRGSLSKPIFSLKLFFGFFFQLSHTNFAELGGFELLKTGFFGLLF